MYLLKLRRDKKNALRQIANVQDSQRKILGYVETLSEVEFLVLSEALRSNSRSVCIQKYHPESSSLVAKGLLSTTENDPTAVKHAFIIPDFIWEYLNDNSNEILTRLHSIEAKQKKMQEESRAKADQAGRSGPFGRFYKSRLPR